MTVSSAFPPAGPRHLWLTGRTRADRAAAASALPAPWLGVVSAHRRLRGPYTAAGTILRRIVPDAAARWPDLVARHQIELLTVAPELTGVVPATAETLTSLAVPDERTRFYSALRTLRIAHGLAEFLTGYLQRAGLDGRMVFIDDVESADYTDQELLAVLLRRIDPALLTVVVGSRPELGADGEGHATGEHVRQLAHPAAGGLLPALARYCDRIDSAATEQPAVPGTSEELAAAYVASDGTDDRPALRAAYDGLPVTERQLLHDRRADELAALDERSCRWGALPFHRLRGSDLLGSGATALLTALDETMLLGFYDATIDFCHQGRRLIDWDQQPELWWLFTTKLPTSLAAVGLVDEAEMICEESRAQTADPQIHHQLAYATAMLYTRHFEPQRRDHDRATGWIQIAIAFSSLSPEIRQRTFLTVFNQNGLALIEAHRGNPERALALVTDGLASLDEVLRPHEQLLHRSVLRYNRGQVLVGLGRLDEALAEYRAVLQLDPNYPEYHFDVANLLHRLGRDEEALAEYETAIRLGPPFPEVHYNRADLLAGLGQLEAALAGFSYVLELDPDYVDALLNRASLLGDAGAADGASRDVEAGLMLEPANPHLLSLRGRLALDGGRLADARADLDRALDSDPALAGAWALRGAVSFEEGDWAAALADLSRSIELEPDPAVLFNRGTVHQAMGDWTAAREDFDQVLAQDPDEADAWLHRAQCRAGLGDRSGSDADVRAFLRLAPERAEEAAALLRGGSRPAVGAGVGPA